MRQELQARSQIRSSRPFNTCHAPAKSLKQRQISRVSASLCSRKVVRELLPRRNQPRYNIKAGSMLPLPLPKVAAKWLEPNAYQFRETSKFSYRKTTILWAPSMPLARARLYSYNPYPNFNRHSLSSSPSKRTTSLILGTISSVAIMRVLLAARPHSVLAVSLRVKMRR